MSAHRRRIVSFLSVALISGLLPAQEKPKTVDELRKKNADLRQQVKTLQSQLVAKKNAANRKALAATKNQKNAAKAFEQLLVVRAQKDVRQALLAQLVQAEVHAQGRLPKGDYRKSVEKLRRATQSLATIYDPAKARKAADEIERTLLDVRRELGKLEQAKKKKEEEAPAQTGARNHEASHRGSTSTCLCQS